VIVKKLPNHIISFSSCSESIIDTLFNLVTYIGDCRIVEEVTENTTVLVLGQNNRSLKVLTAMALGIFVVTPRWISGCMDKGYWLDPTPYEASHWFPGTTQSRLAKTGCKGSLFQDKKIFIERSINIPLVEFEFILKKLGANLTQSKFTCDLIISDEKNDKSSTPILPPRWILDSLSNWKLMPQTDYLR